MTLDLERISCLTQKAGARKEKFDKLNYYKNI